MKKGDRVRLTAKCKREMTGARGMFDSHEHVDEFGDCVGVVLGPCNRDGTELEVRWEPSGLIYWYEPNMLEPA